MKLSYLKEFIVLSKYLNFSVAAKRLHMTQPGLSRHISGLENEVGVKLFDRDTHGVKLTDKGEHFLRGVQKIIDDYDFLCEAVAKGGMEKITIGVPYYGVRKYLSHVVSSFESANSMAQLNYLPAYPDEIIAGLFSKQVDVAVLPRVDFPHAEDLVFHDTFIEPVVLLVNRNNPLARRTGVHIRDLKNEELITLKGVWGTALFEEWYDLCVQRGFSPSRKTLETRTIEEAALSVKPDKGVMLLPEHLKQVNFSGNVTFIDVFDEDFYLTISLIHHPENRNPIIEKFIRFYLQQYGK